MALRTNKQTATVHIDPLSLNMDIKVLSGNAVQVFNKETQEYISDRTLVPLVIIPEVQAVDPHGVQNGTQVLTNVEWYEGTPKSIGTNRIVNGVDYEIGTGSVAGIPKYALKVKKNVDPDTPIEIFAIAIFTDRRRNTEIRTEKSIKLYTDYFDAQNYSVKIDKPSGWTIDPLQVIPDKDGYWKHTITAQLYSGMIKTEDNHTAYWWEIFENGKWRAINNDDIAIWIDCKDASGNFTKTLTFDARLIDQKVTFRVRASYYGTTRPSSPSFEELQATTAITMEFPKSLSVEQMQIKGARIGADMSNPVAYEVIISYNKGIVGREKDHLFQIDWYGHSTKPGALPKKLGRGRNIEFIPKAYGFDPVYPINIYAEVKLLTSYAALIVKSTSAAHPDSFITVEGVPLIKPIYK